MSCIVSSKAWPRCSWPVTFGGGDNDGEGLLLGVALGVEVVALQPEVVNLLLDLMGVVDFRKLFHGFLLSNCSGKTKTPELMLQGA